MAIHQYIGARYVPYYYENSLDPTSTLWEANVIYEPLTVVTLPNQHSYISKKTVPAEIGTPADNAEYWLDTGSDNAYIQELQTEVNNLRVGVAPEFDENTNYLAGDIVWEDGILYIFTTNHSAGAFDPTEVSTYDILSYIKSLQPLDKRRYIIVADSYGTIVNSVTPFTDVLKTNLGASSDDFYNFSEGSMGFAHAGNGGHTAYTLLQANISSVDDPDTITDVILTVGLNDVTESASDIRSGINSVYNLITSTFPNAKIWYGYIGNKCGKSASEKTGYFNSMWVCNEAFYTKECEVMAGIEYLMHILKWLQADQVHPNATGAQQLGYYIAQFLRGGKPIFRYHETIDITGALAGNQIEMYIEGGTTTFEFRRANVATAIAVSDRNYKVGGTLTNPPVMFENLDPVYIAAAWYTSINAYEFGSLGLAAGTVYVCVPNGASGKTILSAAAPMYVQGNTCCDTLLL